METSEDIKVITVFSRYSVIQFRCIVYENVVVFVVKAETDNMIGYEAKKLKYSENIKEMEFFLYSYKIGDKIALI